MKKDLERLKARIAAVKKAPMLTKAQAAELALEDAVHLLGRLVNKVEQLECDETPFGCGVCDVCLQVDAMQCENEPE